MSCGTHANALHYTYEHATSHALVSRDAARDIGFDRWRIGHGTASPLGQDSPSIGPQMCASVTVSHPPSNLYQRGIETYKKNLYFTSVTVLPRCFQDKILPLARKCVRLLE